MHDDYNVCDQVLNLFIFYLSKNISELELGLRIKATRNNRILMLEDNRALLVIKNGRSELSSGI
jgi:hypothetical protein